MLMDLLFAAADGVVQHRRRLHFHAVHAVLFSKPLSVDWHG